MPNGDAIFKYELVHKGKTIVIVRATDDTHYITSVELAINGKDVDTVNDETRFNVFKAFEALYEKQEEENKKRIEIEQAKQNVETVFNMIGRQIFGESKQK